MMADFDNVEIIEELILEILLRLPPISVLRFKCVCKKWYSLISNPDFLRSHSSLQFQKHTDLLVHGYFLPVPSMCQPFDFVCLPQDKIQPPLLKSIDCYPLSLFLQNHSHCYLQDSCNGLLLLICYTKTSKLSLNNITYYVFNLITKHYSKLPNTNPIPNTTEEEIEGKTFIVFDPSISLSYKVIKWINHESENESESEIPGNLHCQLYSSKTGSWRLLSVSFPIGGYSGFVSRPTLLDGVLYWSFLSTPVDVSCCFDVEEESVSFLPLPPKPIGCNFRQCLYWGECGGRLRLIERYLDTLDCVDPNLPFSFDIMEMEPEQEQEQQEQKCQVRCSPWILKYHVDMEMGLNCLVVREHPLKVAFIHCYKTKNKGGEEEEALLLSINHTSIVSFNLTSNTFGEELSVEDSTAPTLFSYNFRHIFPFTPTLFPIS